MKKKKILILSANPKETTQLGLDKEVQEIENALKLAQKRDEFEIAAKWAVRVEDLRRALLDEHKPNIVHFSGHGAGEEGLVFENESGNMQKVSGESLANLFEYFRGFVECVILNACYSEIQAEVIYQQVDCVIGMNQPIGDKAAIDFATGFYDALGAGENYDYAFKIGCNSIQLKGSWQHSIPVIKYRPSSVHSKSKHGAIEEQSQQSKDKNPSIAGDNMPGGQKIGGNLNTGGGDNIVNGNKTTYGGDKFSGDKFSGDKFGGDKINVGKISDSTGIAIGRGASATASKIINQLQNSNNPKAQELADLLKQLQADIEKDNSELNQNDRKKALKHLKTIGKFGSDRQNSDLRDAAETALDALPTIFNQEPRSNKTHIANLITSIKNNLSL